MMLEVCWDGLWTLSFGLSQVRGHGSWLMCEVALSYVMNGYEESTPLFEWVVMDGGSPLPYSKLAGVHHAITGAFLVWRKRLASCPFRECPLGLLSVLQLLALTYNLQQTI